jgi:hypothetical protein
MPARLREIRRAALSYGIQIEEPSSGSHWHCRLPGKRLYTIPAHNGVRTEIDDNYVRGFCRHFSINYDEFKAKL